MIVALPFYRILAPRDLGLAVLSLLVGAILAVVQTDVKRMLAYSSINHAGFILVGVVAASYRAGEPTAAPECRAPRVPPGVRRTSSAPSPSSASSPAGATRRRTSTPSVPCRAVARPWRWR